MAKDANDGLHFWNLSQIDKSLFRDYCLLRRSVRNEIFQSDRQNPEIYWNQQNLKCQSESQEWEHETMNTYTSNSLDCWL